MFVIKEGGFYYICYDDVVGEYIYSTSTYSAKKFETLEELDAEVEKCNISGYCVGVVESYVSEDEV